MILNEIENLYLRVLISEVQNEIDVPSVNCANLKEKLINLLTFLTTSEGRTNLNCRQTDNYFMFNESWTKLPEDFIGLFADISGALHDSVKCPEIAKDASSTPGQLLERTRELKF